jgi:hypothetical protein
MPTATFIYGFSFFVLKNNYYQMVQKMRCKKMNSKKGQGLSLNVIIVAALALIVLVVLIVVFTGRVQVFKEGVSKEGQTELVKMKLFYGQCRPGESFENSFVTQFGNAESPDDRDFAKTEFRNEIDRCKEFADSKGSCESESGCIWR